MAWHHGICLTDTDNRPISCKVQSMLRFADRSTDKHPHWSTDIRKAISIQSLDPWTQRKKTNQPANEPTIKPTKERKNERTNKTNWRANCFFIIKTWLYVSSNCSRVPANSRSIDQQSWHRLIYYHHHRHRQKQHIIQITSLTADSAN